MNNYLLVRCPNTGKWGYEWPGNGPRYCWIKGSEIVPPMMILDRMCMRGHLTYRIHFEGAEVTSREWADLLEGGEMRLDQLDWRILSEKDPLTLAGFSSVLIAANTATLKSRKNVAVWYKKPTSKKMIKNSWLYN